MRGDAVATLRGSRASPRGGGAHLGDARARACAPAAHLVRWALRHLRGRGGGGGEGEAVGAPATAARAQLLERATVDAPCSRPRAPSARALCWRRCSLWRAGGGAVNTCAQSAARRERLATSSARARARTPTQPHSHSYVTSTTLLRERLHSRRSHLPCGRLRAFPRVVARARRGVALLLVEYVVDALCARVLLVRASVRVVLHAACPSQRVAPHCSPRRVRAWL